MIPEGTDASAVTPEQIATVAADAENFIRTYQLSRKEVAKALGYSPGVISEFLQGKYKGDSARVAIDFDAWLVEEEPRRLRPQTTTFVWANMGLQIKSVAMYCLDKRKIGLVYGPDTSGTGKTTALRAIHQELGPRRCSLATIDKVDATPTGLLKKLCAAIGCDDSGSNKHKFDRLVDKLTGRAHLLLIDQVHNLRWAKNDKPFYHLTDLWDATSTAQLWCGTADLVVYLEKQTKRNADESLAQVCRRIFPRVDLMEGVRPGAGGDGGGELVADVRQVREMFAKNKLKLTDAAGRFLTKIANQPDSGSLGLCVQIVEYATAIGEQQGIKTIDVPTLQQALRLGLSRQRTDLLLHKMDEPEVRQMKVG